MKKLASILTLLLVPLPLLAFDGYWDNFAMLAIVLGLLIALAWGLKKYGPVAGVKQNLNLEVLGQVPLNQRSSLALVRAGKQVLLLGVSQSNVSLLKEMEDYDEES